MTETSGGFLLPSQTSHTRGGAGQGSSPVGDVAGVKLDQYKRYLFTPPSTPDADLEPWTRVTTVSAFGVNQGGLRVWTEWKILGGLILAPALRSRLAVAEPDDKDELNSILEEAKTRGGVHDAAAEGTARHKELERWVEMGADYPGPPPEVAADVTAAIRCILDAGLQIVRIENLICIESLRVAGRVDVYAQAPNGKLRALDWKTGKDAVGTPAKRAQFSMQLAPYGNASHVRRPDGTWQLADELNIDHETAYLVHVHDGVAQLYDVPLVEGWRAFQAAYILHRHSSTNGAPTFLPIGRPARFNPLIEDLEPMPVKHPNQWEPTELASDRAPRAVRPMRCPNCEQSTCVVSLAGDWNCDACQVFGVDYDELMAAKEQGGDDGSSAEPASEPEIVVSTQALRTWSPAPDLAPLADRSKGERGCGACGRKGHKRGSDKCLGDADPAKRPSTFSPIKAEETGNGWTDPTPDPFPQPPATPVADDYCDGRCDSIGSDRMTPERDEDGKVTGRYVCKDCGRPGTVAAVRAHVSSFSGDARPAEEREATRERLVQPATIPDPPAQKEETKPAWLPSVAETYAADIQACASRDHLNQLMTRIQEQGQMTDELKMLAFQKWSTLPG